MTKIRNERVDITTDLSELKQKAGGGGGVNYKGILWQFYANKLRNLEWTNS